MYKQLILSLAVIKEKAAYLIVILASLVFALISRLMSSPVVEDSEDTIITMSLSETLAMITFLMLLTLFLNKQYNLTKYKMSEWYYSQPASMKQVVQGDIALILIAHIASYLYWIVFNFLNQTPEKSNIMLMVIAVSLLVHGLYLIRLYQNGGEIDMVMSLLYFLPVFIAFCFHAMLIRNDLDMQLHLSESAGWHFYLYQLPYLTLVGTVIAMIVSYIVTSRRINRQHDLA